MRMSSLLVLIVGCAAGPRAPTRDVELSAEEVPAVVRATAERELGGGARIEYERQGDGTYEAEARFGKIEREVTIAADGRVLGHEEEQADDDDRELDGDDDDGDDD